MASNIDASSGISHATLRTAVTLCRMNNRQTAHTDHSSTFHAWKPDGKVDSCCASIPSPSRGVAWTRMTYKLLTTKTLSINDYYEWNIFGRTLNMTPIYLFDLHV